MITEEAFWERCLLFTMDRAEKTAKCKGLLKQAAKTGHGRVERTFHHYTNDKEFPEG